MSKGAKEKHNFKKLKEEGEKHTYPGALEVNSFIKIKRGNDTYFCKIIAVRPCEKPELSSEKEKNSNKEKQKDEKTPNEYSYDYYIHYVNFDRRNDHWITRKEIIETNIKEDETKDQNIVATSEIVFNNNENEGMDDPGVKAHEVATKIRTIDEIIMGKHRCSTWYFSPFPEEYHQKILYICEFCLNFYVRKEELERHITTNCHLKHPPGNEIYRDNNISMFEVDGKTEQYIAKIYHIFLNYF